MDRVVQTLTPTDEVYDNFVEEPLADIVVEDVKLQNIEHKDISQAKRDRLYADPWAWKDELVALKQSAEMNLTSIKTKIYVYQLHLSFAQDDPEYYMVVSHPDYEDEYLYCAEIAAELENSRNRRVGSVRFLHALETKLIEAKAAIRNAS